MTRDQIIIKAQGLRKNGASYVEIASELYREGVKSPRGGKYTGTAIAKMLERAPRAMPQAVEAASQAHGSKKSAALKIIETVIDSALSERKKFDLLQLLTNDFNV